MEAKQLTTQQEGIVSVYLKTSMGLQAITIDKVDFLVGSSPEADITIKHPSIAKQHVYFTIKDEKMWIFDMSQGVQIVNQRSIK